jgi:hypothetical protein
MKTFDKIKEGFILLLVVCSVPTIAMATGTLTHTFCESGCDYTNVSSTLAHLESAHTNLVALDVNAEILSNTAWTNAMNDVVSIGTTIVTDATHLIIIKASGAATHDGRARAVSGRSNLVWTPSPDETPIINHNQYVRITGIEFKGWSNGGNFYNGIWLTSATGYGVQVDNCIFHDSPGRTRGIYTDAGHPLIFDNIVYNLSASENLGSGIIGGGSVYNNTVYNVHGGSDNYGVGIVAWGDNFKNNISVGNEYKSYGDYTGSASNNYNISSDALANGANDIPNISAADLFVSVTPGAEDFRLKNGAVAIGAGANLSSTFTTDIAGETRTLPWDIGAFKSAPVVALGSVITGNWKDTVFK